jgi:hypothetical protein
LINQTEKWNEICSFKRIGDEAEEKNGPMEALLSDQKIK